MGSNYRAGPPHTHLWSSAAQEFARLFRNEKKHISFGSGDFVRISYRASHALSSALCPRCMQSTECDVLSKAYPTPPLSSFAYLRAPQGRTAACIRWVLNYLGLQIVTRLQLLCSGFVIFTKEKKNSIHCFPARFGIALMSAAPSEGFHCL